VGGAILILFFNVKFANLFFASVGIGLSADEPLKRKVGEHNAAFLPRSGDLVHC
jgi:hypothetical protein